MINNYDLLFEQPDNKSAEWDSRMFELGEKGDVEALERHIATASAVYIDEYQIVGCLQSLYADDVSQEKKDLLLKGLKENKYIDCVGFDDDNFCLKSAFVELKAKKLSKLFPEFVKKNKLIISQKREGNCHWGSLYLSNFLLKNGVSHNVVTGNIYGLSDKARYLHTWIETEINNEQVVLDFTMNSVVNKAGYYALRHAEALSSINGENISKDCELLKSLGIKTGIKPYMLFRDELVKEVNKNLTSIEM